MEVTVKMFQKRLRQVLTAGIAAILLLSTLTAMASPLTMAAPVAQDLSSEAVAGELPGGQFSKIWLKVTPNGNGDVVITSEWNHNFPESNGLGFYVLDSNGLASVINGSKRLAQANLAAGSRPASNSPDNVLGATVSPQTGEVTVVLFNDSPNDAEFTLKATNAAISDDSGQVRDLNAAPTSAATDENGTPVAESSETPEPDATEAAATATVTATTVTTEATATSTPKPEATATATKVVSSTLPSNVKVDGGVVSSPEMEGELPTQNTQHYFKLIPDENNGDVTLTLSFDPQDSSELARRLNFWLLNEAGFNKYSDPTSDVVLSELAIAAGSTAPGLLPNQRQAKFTSSGVGPYVLIVYNNSTVPGTYKVVAQGAQLLDDSKQSITAQNALSGGTTATATSGGEAEPAATTESGSTASPAATTAATTGSTREGEPGGTYTVQAGDSISLIARDIYGEISAWEALCKFNGLSDCNAIEVGQVLKLPTREEIGAGAVAAATQAPAATATATPAGAAAVAGAATQETETTTETVTATATATAIPKASTAITSTSGVTKTGTTTETGTTSTTNSTSSNSGSSSSASANLVETLEATGGFSTLLQALRAANLTPALEGAGPYTIFAPTDAAFSGLPSGAMDQLLNNPTGQLTQILLFHVLPGAVTTDDIDDGMQAVTQQGKAVNFEVGADGTIKINGANVAEPDIDASNGVIHPIDSVILPPN